MQQRRFENSDEKYVSHGYIQSCAFPSCQLLVTSCGKLAEQLLAVNKELFSRRFVGACAESVWQTVVLFCSP